MAPLLPRGGSLCRFCEYGCEGRSELQRRLRVTRISTPTFPSSPPTSKWPPSCPCPHPRLQVGKVSRQLAGGMGCWGQGQEVEAGGRRPLLLGGQREGGNLPQPPTWPQQGQRDAACPWVSLCSDSLWGWQSLPPSPSRPLSLHPCPFTPVVRCQGSERAGRPGGGHGQDPRVRGRSEGTGLQGACGTLETRTQARGSEPRPAQPPCGEGRPSDRRLLRAGGGGRGGGP